MEMAHTLTHAHTHTRPRLRTHVHAPTPTPKHAHAHTHTHTHTHKHAHTRHTHTHTHAHMHTVSAFNWFLPCLRPTFNFTHFKRTISAHTFATVAHLSSPFLAIYLHAPAQLPLQVPRKSNSKRGSLSRGTGMAYSPRCMVGCVQERLEECVCACVCVCVWCVCVSVCVCMCVCVCVHVCVCVRASCVIGCKLCKRKKGCQLICTEARQHRAYSS